MTKSPPLIGFLCAVSGYAMAAAAPAERMLPKRSII